MGTSSLTDELILSKFDSIDENKDGLINIKQIEKCFLDLKLPISTKDINELHKYLSLNHIKNNDDNDILISKELFLKIFRSREKRIYEVYKALDNNIIITNEGEHRHDVLTLRESLIKLGLKASDDEIRNFIQYYDRYKKGNLSYDEFIFYLSSLPMNNPKAAFDEYLTKYSAIKFGTSDYTTSTQTTSSSSSSSRVHTGTSKAVDSSVYIQPSLDEDEDEDINGIDSGNSKVPQKYFSNGTIQLVSGAIGGSL